MLLQWYAAGKNLVFKYFVWIEAGKRGNYKSNVSMAAIISH